MACDNYKSYLVTLGEVIGQYAKEAKINKDRSIGTEYEQFATGYLSGFHRIITLMQQHAEIFDIPLSELRLDDINEIDLI